MAYLPKTKILLENIINLIFIYLLAPFIVQKFKKSLPADPGLWGCAIFEPKIAHFPKQQFFFRKPVNEPCFFHPLLPTCQKSKSDINLLVKYWQLKNIEVSLAERHFGYNFRNRFFPNTFVLHKFQTKLMTDVIFIKSPKTLFWAIFDHFWSFLSDRDFFQKIRLCHTQLYMGP